MIIIMVLQTPTRKEEEEEKKTNNNPNVNPVDTKVDYHQSYGRVLSCWLCSQ